MLEVKFTLAKKKVSPLVQVAVSLAIAWIGMLMVKFTGMEPSRAYFAAFVGIIFFCLINTVVSIAYNSFLRYTVISYYIYIGLIVVLLLSARFFSGISIWKLESYRNMLVSISIFYLMASLMVRAIRYIYEMAESDR